MKIRLLKNVEPSFVIISIIVCSVLAYATILISTRSLDVSAAAGVPDAPVVIFTEDFQNTPSTDIVSLDNYTGDYNGMTYTADPAWLDNCNGDILSFNTPDSEFTNSTCNTAAGNNTNLAVGYDQLRRMAYALAKLNGVSNSAANSNNALSAYTDNGSGPADPGANKKQFEMTKAFRPDLSGQRFLIVNVDGAAANCDSDGVVFSKLVFYLYNDGSPIKINNTPLSICGDKNVKTFTPPSKESNGALGPSEGQLWAASLLGDRAQLANVATQRLVLINQQGSGLGNDNALDNIKISDASPSLDKVFKPASVKVGGISRLTITVTNTTEKFAKNGWSFTDKLPTNLVVASKPDIATTCPSGETEVSSDKKSIDFSGNLSLNMVSCTFSINVTSSSPGTYKNGPSNIISRVGVLPPPEAKVVFIPGAPKAGETLIKSSRLPAYAAGITGIGLALLLGRRKLSGLIGR